MRIREVKGKELKRVKHWLNGLEEKRDKSNDYKVLKFYRKLEEEIKGTEVQCFGNEVIRHEGKYKKASVEISYFKGGLGFGPSISLVLAYGKVYHMDVPNRATYSTKGISGSSIGIEENPEGKCGSAIPHKKEMKKEELASLDDYYHQVSTAKDLLNLNYLNKPLIKEGEVGSASWIEKLLKNKGKNYNRLLVGW